MPKERWKVIDNHPNYIISSLGNVMNIKTRNLLSPYDDGKGYLRVKIDGRCERLHILVAVAFIDKPEGKDIVNHKKGKKHDCRASQLEWVTQSENIQHAWNTGLCSRG
ncbi:MAG: NUMOD4 domain-containing protein [Oscillospiraceae bacterium]|nr:NUMOD4 domain-containing protein [Oscillospiraceae bacterium]